MRAAILAAFVAALSTPSASAQQWTFEQALRQSAGHPSSAILPNVPDNVELAFWQCVASAYVHTQIGTAELAQLDVQVNSGDLTQEPIRSRLASWVDYVKHSTPDDPVTQSIDTYATQSSCAADYNAFLAAYRRGS
jgi:hypothetical protein